MKTHSLNLWRAVVLVTLAVTLVACGTGTTANGSASSNAPVATTSSVTTSTTSDSVSTAIVKLNLNTASANEFAAVPNAGSRMAREFAEYRPYTSILQFRKEIGKYVDTQQVAAYEQYLYVPVDVNQADTETLKQLPGVTDTVAAQLIAARPYASTDAFLTKLGTLVNADQATAAKNYLAG